MLPRAEFPHDAVRGVGEGDFAAIVGRVSQGFLAALFDKQDVQAAVCGCGGEAEAGPMPIMTISQVCCMVKPLLG